MRSVFFRSFFLTATLIFVSFLTLGVLFVGLASGYLANQRSMQLDVSANAVLGMSGYYVDGNRLAIWPEFMVNLNAAGQLSDATIFVTNSTGRIVACSDVNCVHLGQTVSDNTLQSIYNQKTIDSHALSDLFHEDRISVGRIIVGPTGSVGGYLVVSSTATWQNGTVGRFVQLFTMAGLGVLMISCVSAYWTSRRMARPLQIMALASRRFARGDFAIRVPRTGTADEIDELSEAFNAMADALQKAEELRSGFIANVSHEIKTPMTSIAGFIDGIIDGTIPQEKRPEYLSAIRSEVMRLSRLVSGMLELTRLQAGGQKQAPRSFDIVELLCRTLLSFETAIEKKSLQVETQLPDEAVVVLADPDAITQVVYNLLDNAIKYSCEGGSLWVKLSKKGSKLYVSIRNEGPTIPPDDLPYIFERFHKIDKSRGVDKNSLGLGLFIVKTILGNMQESITVTSENNVTELTFTLSENKR